MTNNITPINGTAQHIESGDLPTRWRDICATESEGGRMTTITPFPIRRHPTAEPQRTTCDAGRPLRSLPIGAGTYSHGPNALGADVAGRDTRVTEQRGGFNSRRSTTYLPRRHLALSAFVCLTIALVAGVALVWSMT